MKSIPQILSVSLAAGTAGVALLTFGGLLSADLGFASLSVLGLSAIALFDYSRPARTLRGPAAILRPTLPVVSTPTDRLVRRAA